ncbi:uncharacterized protein LODBEIA_P48390 [Lodderomyces beijingensis]|uniref:BTB domain-containing protein n=1 Tax=Lodderomyces beijingensis TaxID=1775926 RepID=A0ABP0ZR28_9ASCO
MSLTTLPIQTFDEYDPAVPVVLPHEKVYSIQVGYKLFRLSGLSLSSDSPSYFTKFFSHPENKEKVLFFDRSPQVFEKIYNHLQGYSINITNDYEFMHLWSDAFYFGLSGLRKVLTEQDYFASIGSESFKIPRALLQSKGNSPNYFTINAERLLSDNLQVIERKNMMRPPPQRPAVVTGRSSDLFRDLLEVLKGNPSVIKSEEHRLLLMKEARYYRFLELEQRMVSHKVCKGCIVLNLNHLARRGLSNPSPSDKSIERPMQYSRPYIEEPVRDLIFQVDSEEDPGTAVLFLNKRTSLATVVFRDKVFAKLVQVFKGLISGTIVDETSMTFFAGFGRSHTLINGREMKSSWVTDLIGENPAFPSEEERDEKRASKKRKMSDKVEGDVIEIFLKRSMWKLLMRGNLGRLEAVSIDGLTGLGQERIDFL